MSLLLVIKHFPLPVPTQTCYKSNIKNARRSKRVVSTLYFRNISPCQGRA